MSKTQVEYNRITFSLPSKMNNALDMLKDEIRLSKSEIIKLAIENYLTERKKIKIQKAVELMSSEYRNNSKLTELTVLDGADFL